MPKIDSAVLSVLGLNPSVTTVASHGSSGFTSTFKISTEDEDGEKQCFFMKTGKRTTASIMFHGEFESLNAIHKAVPSLCPRALAYGELEDKRGYYLVTDFLNLSTHFSKASSSSGESLASKLAKLHTTPQPSEFNNKFGFHVSTCCGSTIQDNTWEENWADFFGKRRLMHILAESETKNGPDKELRQWVEKTVSFVVPRLLGGLKDAKPVVVHGDLWSGNASKGSLGEDGRTEELIFDPSACYAHNEYEFGIMKMFGGFGSVFFREYHGLIPKTEPVDEYDDRVELYQLYHQLNHHALFGSGYRSGAISMMEALNTKYGKGR